MPVDTNCEVSVTQTRRSGDGGVYESGGLYYQIYDLTFSNTGSEPVTFAQFDQAFPGSEMTTSYWNLVKTCCTQIQSAASYNVTLPDDYLPVGSTVDAGFILQYSGTLTDPEYSSPIVQTQYYQFVRCD